MRRLTRADPIFLKMRLFPARATLRLAQRGPMPVMHERRNFYDGFDPRSLTGAQLKAAAKQMSEMSDDEMQRMMDLAANMSSEQRQAMQKMGIDLDMMDQVVQTAKAHPDSIRQAQGEMKDMTEEDLLAAKRMAEEVSQQAMAEEKVRNEASTTSKQEEAEAEWSDPDEAEGSETERCTEEAEILAGYRDEAASMPLRDLQEKMQLMGVAYAGMFERSQLDDAFARAKLGETRLKE